MGEENKAPTNEEQVADFEVTVTDAAQPEENTAADAGDGKAKPEGEDAGKDADDDGKKPEDDSNAGDAGAGDDKPKGSNRFQKRIDKLTRRASEAERRAQEAERKLAERGEKKPVEKQPEPEPSDFDNYDDYLAELSDWKKGASKADDKDSGKKPEASDDGDDDREDQEFTDALEDVKAAFIDIRDRYDDFDEVTNDKDVTITRDMVMALAEADDPGEIAYYLGKNKAEAERISKLKPIAQAREIGKLEAKLAKKEPDGNKPIGKKTTQAPDPIEPIRGGDSSKKKLDDMNFSEFEQTRNDQERNSGGFW
jgi:hypothetical protein